jgi:Protein of unknown function (DUF992)
MFRRCLTLVAFALIVMLAPPADAQSPPSWTQAGMLRCVVNPSIGFIIAGHQSMECKFTQNGPNPPQAYQGALNMVGLNIGISAGGVFGWAVFAPTTARRRAGRRICWRFGRHRPRCRRWRQRPHRWFRAYLRAAAALTGGLGGHRCCPRRLRAQVALGILSLRPVSRTVAGRKNTHARPEPRN